MHKVNSSILLEVGYDKVSKILKVKLRDGSIYEYFGVPEEVYHNLMAADSKGKYAYEHIFEKFRLREIR